MKKLSLLSVLLLGYMIALAQNMGIGTLNPDPSAKLEISSIDKGLLIPRVNTTQRQGIINPATGLLVFDTDTKTFWYYNASSWINLDLLNAAGKRIFESQRDDQQLHADKFKSAEQHCHGTRDQRGDTERDAVALS